MAAGYRRSGGRVAGEGTLRSMLERDERTGLNSGSFWMVRHLWPTRRSREEACRGAAGRGRRGERRSGRGAAEEKVRRLWAMRVLGAGVENQASRCFRAFLVSVGLENRKQIKIFGWAFRLFSSKIRL